MILQIQGADTMEDTNEEKKVIKVEAKEIDNSMKLGNSEPLREDNKRDAEVKNIKDINNFHSRRWGCSLPGLRTRDPLLSPQSTPAVIFRRTSLGGVGGNCLTVFLINFLAKSENSKHFSFCFF